MRDFDTDEILEKIAKFLNSVTDKTISLVCILLFLMCAYALYDTVMVYDKAEDKTLARYKPETSITEVSSVMPDCIAWLTIDDTNIDYPVMQGRTNSDYINTDPYGNYSLSGSIFLDCRNSPEFTDPYSLIYGHHMDYGAMFGSLDDFLDRQYFESHRTGTLLCRRRQYKITLYAVVKTDASVDVVFEPTQADAMIADYIRENALIYETPEYGNIIGLSTCSDTSSTDRLVVFGILHN